MIVDAARAEALAHTVLDTKVAEGDAVNFKTDLIGAFIGDYSYASDQQNGETPTSERSVLQRTGDNLRAEATKLLENTPF